MQIDFRENNIWNVYIYANKINNKLYVGQTNRTLKKRAGVDGKNYVNSKYFWHAIQKYGWENFEPEIVASNLTHDEANKLEISLIHILKTQDPKFGYNIAMGGQYSNKSPRENLVGRKFSYLQVIEEIPNSDNVVCVCECGNTKTIDRYNLLSGKTTSCGCYVRKNQADLHTKHGMSDSSIYARWNGMIRRCFSTTDKDYENNGAIGITVCDEWIGEHGFENFYQWALENGYQEELIFDRIDNKQNYSPENCRWVTKQKKAEHKSNAVTYEYNGKKQNLERWSEELKINRLTLWNRIHKLNMTIEEAFTTPVNSFVKYYEFNGEQHTLREWSEILGIKYKTLCTRIYSHKWDIEKAFTTPTKKI